MFCPYCKIDNPDGLKNCKGCGAYLKQANKTYSLTIVLGFVALFLLVVVLGFWYLTNTNKYAYTDDFTQISTTQEPSNTIAKINVTASQIGDDYEANVISADKKYKNNYIEVTGNIDQIDYEITGKPFVTFVTDNGYVIQAVFPKELENKIAKLSKGENISICGICKGAMLSYVEIEGDKIR